MACSLLVSSWIRSRCSAPRMAAASALASEAAQRDSPVVIRPRGGPGRRGRQPEGARRRPPPVRPASAVVRGQVVGDERRLGRCRGPQVVRDRAGQQGPVWPRRPTDATWGRPAPPWRDPRRTPRGRGTGTAGPRRRVRPGRALGQLEQYRGAGALVGLPGRRAVGVGDRERGHRHEREQQRGVQGISVVVRPVARPDGHVGGEPRFANASTCHGDTPLITPRIWARQHRFTAVNATIPTTPTSPGGHHPGRAGDQMHDEDRAPTRRPCTCRG